MIQKLPSLDEAKRLWKENRHEEARSVIEALVAWQPQNEAAWLALARMSPDRARQHEALLKVLEINPNNAVAQRILQEKFGDRGTPLRQEIEGLMAEVIFAEDWAQAERLYGAVLQLDPTHSEAVNALLRHYAQAEEWQKGFRLLNALRERAPQSDFLVDRQLQFAIRAGSLDYLRSMDDVLLGHPRVTVKDLLKVSELFAKQYQYDVVAALLERASELEPDNQTLLFGLANAYDILKRPAEAKRTRQRIADVDHSSKLGRGMMMRFLEEDPYVPLTMRENTLVAVREAVGLLIPLVMLLYLDNRLSLLGMERLLGLVFGAVGFYLLVTATSSHEQKIWQRLIPGGLNENFRYFLGGMGALLAAVGLYFALLTSFHQMDEFDRWEQDACQEMAVVTENMEYYDPADPCAWLYDPYFYGG
jgi:thioredoxin-like negative regulator of GroEL